MVTPPCPVPVVACSGKLETGPGENGRQQLGSQHLNKYRKASFSQITEVTQYATGILCTFNRNAHGVMHERAEDGET